jgi:hypothetical protein
MEPNKLRRRRLRPLWAVILSACALLIGVIPATAAASQAKPDSPGRCTELNMVEVIVHAYGNMTVTSLISPPPGLMGIYFDQLNDSTGTTQVGSAAGHFDIMYKRPDGSDVEYFSENAHLADGTFFVAGSYDRADILGQHWLSFPVKGTSGRYLGMDGTWSWRVLRFTYPSFPIQDKIILCPHDAVSQ